ncbi:MAG: elongation factor G [Micrococcales bacterium]|nr:elongation factor G [Micrococcales bacterium]
MDQATKPRVRTVALLGASGAGKTTLAEALLFRAGVLTRPGKVDDGSTVTDHEPEEIARHISLSLAAAPFSWQAADGHSYDVTLLDAPGFLDFASSVDAAVAAADLVLVLVSAVEGVQAGTYLAWQAAAALGVPRMFVITKEDKQRADFHHVLDELHEAFGEGLVPLELPLGEEEAFTGLADVLAEEAYVYGSDGHYQTQPIPDALADDVAARHEEVIEEIVSHDDEQLEAYLGGEVPSTDDLQKTLAGVVRRGEAFPVLLVSAQTGVGVDRLADLVCSLSPIPTETIATVYAGETAIEVAPDPAGPQLVHAFRTVADPFVGQVTLFRVLSGTIHAGDKLTNTTTGAEERLPGLFRMRGKEHLPIDEVVAGEVAAAPKLGGTPSGSLLVGKGAPGGSSLRARTGKVRQPVYGLSLDPVTQSDDDRLGAALARLVAEDPTLEVGRISDKTVLRGLGDTHLAVALERLARVFSVHVTTSPVPVGYLETIGVLAQAEGKVKKQSGGHGQFAVVNMRVSPLPRGEGYEFADSVVGGSIPRNYMAAVQKGITEGMTAGGPHGYPIVDVKVDVYEGKSHPVDSSDMAFRTASALGLKEALIKAGSVVLEPISRITVTVPTSAQGDVMGDLSTRRGRIADTHTLADGTVRIEALVPESELARYVLDLRSITGGRADLTMEHSHFDVLPSHLVPADS